MIINMILYVIIITYACMTTDHDILQNIHWSHIYNAIPITTIQNCIFPVFTPHHIIEIKHIYSLTRVFVSAINFFQISSFFKNIFKDESGTMFCKFQDNIVLKAIWNTFLVNSDRAVTMKNMSFSWPWSERKRKQKSLNYCHETLQIYTP